MRILLRDIRVYAQAILGPRQRRDPEEAQRVAVQPGRRAGKHQPGPAGVAALRANQFVIGRPSTVSIPTSQILTALSALPETRRLPSGENTIA